MNGDPTPEQQVQNATVAYMRWIIGSRLGGFRVGDTLTVHLADLDVYGEHWDVEVHVTTKLKDTP